MLDEAEFFDCTTLSNISPNIPYTIDSKFQNGWQNIVGAAVVVLNCSFKFGSGNNIIIELKIKARLEFRNMLRMYVIDIEFLIIEFVIWFHQIANVG